MELLVGCQRCVCKDVEVARLSQHRTSLLKNEGCLICVSKVLAGIEALAIRFGPNKGDTRTSKAYLHCGLIDVFKPRFHTEPVDAESVGLELGVHTPQDILSED